MSVDFALARILAKKFHGNQKYGTEPYMYHLEGVADSLYDEDNSDKLRIIAMLHDILEDTAMAAGVLRNLFENDIVDAVVALTKLEGESYEAYIQRVRANKMALTVKIHDTLFNLTSSVRENDTWRITKYSKQLQLLAK